MHYLAVPILTIGDRKGLGIVQAGKHYLLGVGGERNNITELDAKDLVDLSLGTTDFAIFESKQK